MVGKPVVSVDMADYLALLNLMDVSVRARMALDSGIADVWHAAADELDDALLRLRDFPSDCPCKR